MMTESYHNMKITYLQFWLRQKVVWYCKMIQFILVRVCKPMRNKIISLDVQQEKGKDKMLL